MMTGRVDGRGDAGAGCSAGFGRFGLIEQRLTGHEKHTQRFGDFLARVKLNVLLKLEYELIDHGRGVFTGERVGQVQIDQRLFEIFHLEFDVRIEVLAQLLYEREYDRLEELTLRLFRHVVYARLEHLTRIDLFAQVHQQA